MPGVKIRISTEEAQAATKKLAADLARLGLDTKLTEAETAKLEKRMLNKLGADQAKQSVDSLSKSIGLTKKEVAALEGQIASTEIASTRLGRAFSHVGMQMTAAFTIMGAMALGSQMYQKAKDYETALVDMAKVTTRELSLIKADIASLGPELGSGTQLMKGYYQTISAGITEPAKAMEFLTGAAKASKAAHIEQEAVVRGLSKVMAGYSGEIKGVTEASDLLFAMEQEGQTTVAELIPVIGEVAAISKQAGVSSNEMAAALANMTKVSGSTAQASTQYRAIMVSLIKPQEQMRKLLAEVGYESGIAMVKQLGFAGALQKVNEYATKSGLGLGRFFESAEALMALGPMIATNFEGFNASLAVMEDKAGRTEKAFQDWAKTAEGATTIFENTFGGILKEIGQLILPMVVQGLTGMSTWLKENKGDILGFAQGVATVSGWLASAVGVVIEYRNAIINLAIAFGLYKFSIWAAGVYELTTAMIAGTTATKVYSASIVFASGVLTTFNSIMATSALAGVPLYIRALEGVRIALIAMNAALGPVGWAILAVAAAIAGTIWVYKQFTSSQDEAKKKMQEFQEQTDKLDLANAESQVDILDERIANLGKTAAEVSKQKGVLAWLFGGGKIEKEDPTVLKEQRVVVGDRAAILRTAENAKRAARELAAAINKPKTEDAAAKALTEKQRAEAKKREDALKDLVKATEKSQLEIDTFYNTSFDKRIAQINAEVAEHIKATGDIVTVKKWEATQIRLAELKADEEEVKSIEKEIELQIDGMLEVFKESKKIADAKTDDAKKFKELMADEYDFAATENERAVNKIIADTKKKIETIAAMEKKGSITKPVVDKAIAQITANEDKAIFQRQAEMAKEKAAYYKDITGMEEKYRALQTNAIAAEARRQLDMYGDMKAAAQYYYDAIGRMEDELLQKKLTNISSGFSSLGAAFTSISQLYTEGSNEANRWADAAKAMEIAQRGVAVVSAVATIANQGLGDPYTAFARIAAMAAAMAALLASIGEGVGGTSVASSMSPAFGQNTTVLGGENGQGSESISKSWELLKDTYSMEYRELSGIYNEMKDLNDNITGLVASVIRTGSIGSIPFTEFDPQAMLNFMNSDAMGMMWSAHLLGPLSANIPKVLNELLEGIFGGGAFAVGKTELWGSQTGLKFGSGRVGDLAAGGSIGAKSYQEWATRTTTDFWRDDSYDYNYREQELAAETQNMIDSVFKSMSGTIIELAKGLGTDVDAAMNYVFEGARINLQGMSSEQISKTMNEYFSALGDTAVQALFGTILKGYQQVGEGLMETATRILIDKAVVMDSLEMTGQAFVGTIPEIIAFSESLIKLAGDLETLRGYAETYYGKFFTDAEKQTRLQDQLTTALKDQNMALPDARDGYRLLLEGLDLTTDSGKETYLTLLKLAEGADAYYTALEELANTRQDMEIQLMEAQGKTSEVLALRRKLELAAMDESLRPLALLIYAQEDLNTATDAAREAAIAAAQANVDNADAISRAADAAVQAGEKLIEGLTSVLQTIDDWINNMKTGDLAPVSSAEELQRQYEAAKAKAMAVNATADDQKAFLDFSTRYLEFQKSFGTGNSYQAIYDTVMKDVMDMRKFVDSSLTNAVTAQSALTAAAFSAATALSAFKLALEKISAPVVPPVPTLPPTPPLPPTVPIKPPIDPVAADLKRRQDAWRAGLPHASPDAIRIGLYTAEEWLYMEKNPYPTYGEGGYSDRPGIFGEKGGEWAVPTYEPQRSKFLKNMGADPETLGAAIGRYLQSSNGGSDGEATIHNHIYIDGKEIQHCVSKGMKTNPELIKSTRRAVN